MRCGEERAKVLRERGTKKKEVVLITREGVRVRI
jgi:hypothetical protein